MEELKPRWQRNFTAKKRSNAGRSATLRYNEVVALLRSEGYGEGANTLFFYGQGRQTVYVNAVQNKSFYLTQYPPVVKNSRMKIIGSLELIEELFGLTGSDAIDKIRQIQNRD